MPRTIRSPNAGSVYVSALGFSQGGHGQQHANLALVALNGVKPSEVGTAGGPVPMKGGVVEQKYLSGLTLVDASVDGDAVVLTNSITEYFLTSYDVFAEYVLLAYNGTVERKDNVITYKANGSPSAGGFSINGRRVVVQVVSPYVSAPSVLAPVNQSVNVNLEYSVVASDFGFVGSSDTHVSSDWELSTVSDFSTLVASSYGDTVNLKAWQLSDLPATTLLYLRVRYRGERYGLSGWSSVTTFTTGN